MKYMLLMYADKAICGAEKIPATEYGSIVVSKGVESGLG